jgi:pyruvate, orthophosphate dikinase
MAKVYPTGTYATANNVKVSLNAVDVSNFVISINKSFESITNFQPFSKHQPKEPTLIIYPLAFDQPYTGKRDPIDVFGGKGANLRRMISMGMPVPEGFTIPTDWTVQWRNDMYQNFKDQIMVLEEKTGRTFGGTDKPLLVSVRSGAPRSMPGMMETILNVGLNDQTVEALAAETNETFAWDSYRRFIQMFATVVWKLDAAPFNERYDALVEFNGGDPLDADMLKTLVESFCSHINECGYPTIVSDPVKQAWAASEAVFESWNSPKAKSYRKIEGIPEEIGTACNIQRMVFGNLNDQSGTGVAFTRNPNNGEKAYFGDFLVNAQGEDVVAGTHATMPINEMANVMPEQYAQLHEILDKLEAEYHDMCDVEFTVEDGKLYILQTRAGKRSADATIVMALDMLEEGMIDRDTAVDRLKAIKGTAGAGSKSTNMFSGTVIGTGLGAAGSKVVGKVVFDCKKAIDEKAKGEDVILVREETNPEDIAGMAASVGILTKKGGLTSHAAVVSRGWDKTCVVGTESMTLYSDKFILGGITVVEGQEILIDGETGEVFA